jgi:effector-binding domain-containing protein
MLAPEASATMPSKLIRLALAGLLVALVSAGPSNTRADESPTAAQSPAAPTPQAQAPAPQAPTAPAPGIQSPATPAPPTANPSPAPPETAKPSEPAKPSDEEGSTGQTVDLPARPFAYVEGKADRDEIYNAILSSLAAVKRELDKDGIKPAGRPLAEFVESDQSGFRYHAGFPMESPPADKTGLSDVVKIGQTPTGKAMRFQHVGAYADIDATYDAITAYLDEKGIDAQDSFVEEYVNDVKDADDPALEVNIYVLLK